MRYSYWRSSGQLVKSRAPSGERNGKANADFSSFKFYHLRSSKQTLQRQYNPDTCWSCFPRKFRIRRPTSLSAAMASPADKCPAIVVNPVVLLREESIIFYV